MKKLLIGFAFAVFAANSANAAVHEISLSETPSQGSVWGIDTTRLSFNLGAGAQITGFSYDLVLTAFNPSFLSEALILFSNSDLSGFIFQPGGNDQRPGSESYAGTFNLGPDLRFTTNADGLLWLTFAEQYSDIVVPNAVWNGTIQINYEPGIIAGSVPEPASWAMLIAGFGMVGFAARNNRGQRKAIS